MTEGVPIDARPTDDAWYAKPDNGNAPSHKPEASVSAGTSLVGSGSQKMTPTDSLVNTLPTGVFRTDDHWYYWNGTGPLPGVTGTLEIMSKPALVTWKAKEAARAGIRFGAMHANEGFDWDVGILEALKEADSQRDRAAALGTGVHLLADMETMPPGASEKASKGFEIPDEWIPYLDAFRDFLGRYSASSIVSSEKSVISTTHGYGGTYDLLMKLPIEDLGDWSPVTELWLIDIKTSKGYYPEYGLQLAAYRWADFIGLPGDPRPYPMPQIQRTGILHLRPDAYPDTGWRLIEYPTLAYDYEAFIYALELYKWRKEGRFSKSRLVSA